MPIQRILIASADRPFGKSLIDIFHEKNLQTVYEADPVTALAVLKDGAFDLVVADLETKEMTVQEFLQICQKISPQTSVIFVGEQLTKPLEISVLNSILEKLSQRKKSQVIAQDPVIQKLLEDLPKIARSNASVFISGESGTGKEVIASAIHHHSLRCNNAFVKVNCAAIAETLLESEFFGHEKGAFTGAINRRMGRFELADKGTLLLDEISEIPLSLQSKLLRVVQEMEFERVGGTQSINVDVRLISTSNRNMKEAIEQKLFREDLYYRLNVVPIYLPPLRERREDIIPLAEYFLEQLCRENLKRPKTLSIEAKQKLLDHSWPGNIRELANIIERTIVMASTDLITPEQLSIDFLSSPKATAPVAFCEMTLQELEKKHILETISLHRHNRTRAAKVLGISIRTLRNKLTEYAKSP